MKFRTALFRRTLLAAALSVACSAGCREAKPQAGNSATPPASASNTEKEAGNDAAVRATLPKVVFLGDSLSAGLHLAAEQAFPAVVQRRLAARGVRFELRNAGVSGDTTAGGLRRVDWLLKQRPDVVVVELGANDGLRGMPVAQVEQNLRTILSKISASGAKILLLGMRLPPSQGPEYVAAFEAIYPRVAEQLAVPLVPFFMEGVAGMPEMNLEDGLHPTERGHERIADNVTGPLEALLRDPLR